MTSASLSASQEDYLEAIFQISAHKRAARSKDISDRLKVNRSSVTGALQSLAGRGLVNYAPYDLITLTPKGNAAARKVARRHRVLQDFFVGVLGVSVNEAEKDACRMEHTLSRENSRRLALFMEFLDLCPQGRETWVERFRNYCESGSVKEPCEKCAGYPARKDEAGRKKTGDKKKVSKKSSGRAGLRKEA